MEKIMHSISNFTFSSVTRALFLAVLCGVFAHVSCSIISPITVDAVPRTHQTFSPVPPLHRSIYANPVPWGLVPVACIMPSGRTTSCQKQAQAAHCYKLLH